MIPPNRGEMCVRSNSPMRTLKLALLPLAFALAGVLGGCAAGGSQTSAVNGSSSATTLEPRETSQGGYFVTCRPSSNPIPANQMFGLEIGVFRDAERGRPASDVRVWVDAAMPAHHHGMNLAPRVEAVGDGSFKVSGMLMHMPGAWEIYVDVMEGGRTERARFEVQVP